MTMAQSTASVPTDLSSAFDPNSISMQVSYNDNSAEGLKDGTKISQKGKIPTADMAFQINVPQDSPNQAFPPILTASG